jgi:hypothetical protein
VFGLSINISYTWTLYKVRIIQVSVSFRVRGSLYPHASRLDLEQTLKELGSFVRRLSDDKENNRHDIQNQRKEICEQIHKMRKSLNDHLDQLQETLIGSINKTGDDVTLQ